MPRQPTIGDRFVLTRDVDRYPHFVAPAGTKGTVVEVSSDAVTLRMDDLIRGAEEWENEIVWSEDFGWDIWDDAKLIDGGGREGEGR